MSWQFLRAGSYYNILWRRIKLRILEGAQTASTSSYSFRMQRIPELRFSASIGAGGRFGRLHRQCRQHPGRHDHHQHEAEQEGAFPFGIDAEFEEFVSELLGDEDP